MRKLQRRDFLKYSAAGAGIFAADHFFGNIFASDSFDNTGCVGRCTGRKAKGIPTSCTGCFAHCGLIAYVQDGQLMKIAGNPAHPANRGAVCTAGQALIYKLYDPERVTKPLIRTGKRGQGRWKEITWDEAVSVAAEKINANATRGVVLETMGGSSEPASREFLAKIGGRLISHGYAVSQAREKAMSRTFGAPYDLPDMANASYILNFGASPCESGYRGIGDAKMVTFDPRLSMTAGKSDEWYPIMPGTDGIVALAMARVIMSEGLFDGTFIESRTNTGIEKLKFHLAPYTLDLAERISGAPAEAIRKVALDYASADRAALITGGGVSRQRQGTMNERAVRLLSIITGKVNRKGCNIIPAAAGFTAKRAKETAPESFYRSLQDGSARAGVYIVQGADPAYSSPAAGNMGRALENESLVPFLMCIDTHITDTGRFADMILPACTFLEEHGLELSHGQNGEAVYGYRRPVVQPLGESKPYVKTLALIAEGMGKPLGFSGSEQYADWLVAHAPDVPDTGVESAMETAGFYAMPASPGGKARIEAAWGDGLPSFTPPEEYRDLKNTELIMVTFSPSTYREGFTENNMMLKEISHANRAFINAKTGASLGLKSWDKVIISSPAGKAEAVVMLSPGVHPKVLAIARGCGHEGWGRIEKAERFESSDPFTSVIWWEGEGKGVNTNVLVPFNIDEATGDQGWMLSKVNIEKA